jgi:hypothetical protein
VSVTCPQGHVSESTDYCDTCGAPLDAQAPGATPAGARSGSGASADPSLGGVAGSGVAAATGPATSVCPNCQVANPAGALFCEACGYDFTTGALPRGSGSALDLDAPGPGVTPTGPAVAPGGAPAPLAPAVPLEWVAEVWVDPAWYAEQEADEPCPSPGLPAIVPLSVRSVLVGRVSHSRNIHPEVDCGADIGVSRRQAQLSTDGTRWWIEDLQSSNGTYVGQSGGALPTVALVPGQRRELAPDDRVYVGAWTRIVVRRATDEERAAG